MTELNFQKGDDALRYGLYPDAVMYFTKSLSIEKSSAAFHNRAFAYMNLGEMELAKRDYEFEIKMTKEYLDQADKTNIEYIDLCLRDLIDAKATIAHIEMENKNFSDVEVLCNKLISLYNSMHDNSILRKDLHVSNFFSNRGMARFRLNKIEDATSDFGAAFIEYTSEEKREEILLFAEMNGFIEELKQRIEEYHIEKNNVFYNTDYSAEKKIFVMFKVFGLDIKVPVTKINDFTFNYPIPRPIPTENYLSQGDYTMNAAKQEFIDDIKYQLPKSLNGELEEIAFESLYQVMVKHINKFGRILPVDLDSYIGQNILLYNAILQAQGKPMLNKEEQEERFSKFNYMAFGILPDNLKAIYRTPF